MPTHDDDERRDLLPLIEIARMICARALEALEDGEEVSQASLESIIKELRIMLRRHGYVRGSQRRYH